MTENDKQLRNAWMQWLIAGADNFSHAVTLTMKPYRIAHTPKGDMPIVLTHIEAEQNMRFFLKRLNADVYGNQVKRQDKSVYALPVLEGIASDKLLHYHCALGNFPLSVCEDAIQAKITSAWRQTPFGNEQVCITPMQNFGWVRYMSKEIGSYNTVAVDVHNARLPDASLT